MAKNEGKVFEEDWKKSIPSDCYYFRIKDSPSSFGQDSSKARFTLKNPFDAFIYCYPNLFPTELKSTKGTSISIQQDKNDKGKMIKFNQIEGLTEAANYKGIIPGFIFNFRKYGKTYFLHIDDFNKFLNDTDKKSINITNVIEYGGIEIIGEIKRVRYKYYI